MYVIWFLSVRYEAWENKHIAERSRRARLPLWNGLFCAMLPEYTSRGFGSAVYNEVIKTLAKHHLNRHITPTRTNPFFSTHNKQCHRCSSPIRGSTGQNTSDVLDRPLARFLARQMHGFTLLNHNHLPHGMQVQTKCFCETVKSTQSQGVNSTHSIALLPPSTPAKARESASAPLVVAVTHSERAANFHSSNGFRQLTRIPFCDGAEGKLQFYVHVLALDPFRTGRVAEFNEALLNDVDTNVKCNWTLTCSNMERDHVGTCFTCLVSTKWNLHIAIDCFFCSLSLSHSKARTHFAQLPQRFFLSRLLSCVVTLHQ